MLYIRPHKDEVKNQRALAIFKKRELKLAAQKNKLLKKEGKKNA